MSNKVESLSQKSTEGSQNYLELPDMSLSHPVFAVSAKNLDERIRWHTSNDNIDQGIGRFILRGHVPKEKIGTQCVRGIGFPHLVVESTGSTPDNDESSFQRQHSDDTSLPRRRWNPATSECQIQFSTQLLPRTGSRFCWIPSLNDNHLSMHLQQFNSCPSALVIRPEYPGAILL